MRNFLISNDPDYRAATYTEQGLLIAFPHAEGGKIDGGKPVVIDSFAVLSDKAGITERSHLSDPVLESIVTKFTASLPL